MGASRKALGTAALAWVGSALAHNPIPFANSKARIGAFLLLAYPLAFSAPLPVVQEGDLIFQTSRSAQSLAIQRATSSPYSHMGVVFFRHGKPFVFEAVSTVRYTPLGSWIRRGKGGHYVLKRVKEPLSSEEKANLRAHAAVFEGKPYDLTFAWSDERIYCSELVWKLYQRALGLEIGTRQRLRDFRLDDPAVRTKLKERHGAHVPLDEPVISPAAMFQSPRLSTIADR